MCGTDNPNEELVPLHRIKPRDTFSIGLSDDIFRIKGDGVGNSYSIECIESKNISLGTYQLGKDVVVRRRNGGYQKG